MKIKHFHHVCVQTENYKESLGFYVKLLGFSLVKESPGFHTRDFNAWLKGGQMMIELQTPKAGTRFNKWSKLNSGPVHLCIIVDDVKASYDFIKSKGWQDFKIKNGKELYEVEGSLLFKVRAPEGTEIEIRDNPEL